MCFCIFFITLVFTNVTIVPRPITSTDGARRAGGWVHPPSFSPPPVLHPNQGLWTSHSRVSIVSQGHLTDSIHISFVYKNKMEKFQNKQKKSISFVDNCPPKWSDKETEKPSVGVGFKNTGYSTIKNNNHNHKKRHGPGVCTWSMHVFQALPP